MCSSFWKSNVISVTRHLEPLAEAQRHASARFGAARGRRGVGVGRVCDPIMATAWESLVRRQTTADGRSVWQFHGPAEQQQREKVVTGPPYEVRSVPGKGMGIFARRAIAAGERILSEAPLARWAVRADAGREERIHGFATVVADLTPAQTATLLSLSEAGHYAKVPGKRTLMGTWLTNALPINYEDGHGSEDVDEAAVFETICRINHSCLPSCHHEWNPSLRGGQGMETVHALRSIAPGEELSISYLMPAGRPRAERQERLSRQFGFQCTCPLCALSGEALARSDACQRAIGDVSIPGFDGLPLPALLKRLELRLGFIAKEGLPEVWARPLLVAAMVQAVRDKTAEGREKCRQLAARASACVKMSAGADHPSYKVVSSFVAIVEDFENQHGGQVGALPP